jgi:hypothetical protein
MEIVSVSSFRTQPTTLKEVFRSFQLAYFEVIGAPRKFSTAGDQKKNAHNKEN